METVSLLQLSDSHERSACKHINPKSPVRHVSLLIVLTVIIDECLYVSFETNEGIFYIAVLTTNTGQLRGRLKLIVATQTAQGICLY